MTDADVIDAGSKPKNDALGLIVGAGAAAVGLVVAIVVRRQRRKEQEALALAAAAAAAASKRGVFSRLRARRVRPV